MPRTKGATNRNPRRVLVAARLPAEMAEWLKQQPGGITATLEKIIKDKMNPPK